MANRQTPAPVDTETSSARPARKSVTEESARPAISVPSAAVEEAEVVAEVRPETGKRRMPENLRRFLLRMQGGKLYLPAQYRIVWFRDECPDWGIETILLEGGQEAGFATVQARIYNPEGRLLASDLKTETKQDFPAGWVEKAATGSVARALALLGFGTQFMPELDDVEGSTTAGPIGIPAYTQTSSSRGYRNGEMGVREMGDSQAIAAQAVATQAVVAPADSESASTPDTQPPTPTSTIWEGPGQCPRCHAPEGRRHAKPCL